MENRVNLVLTAVGPDRIGLVEQISEFVAGLGCNIEDSKMAVFCGEFALILLISGPETGIEAVLQGYSSLAAQAGLTLTAKKPATTRQSAPVLPFRLTASCMDHPGVVHRISSVLSNLAINIESMETKTYLAPVSGTTIFRLEAIVSVPADLRIQTVRSRFNEIEREENIDIELVLLSKSSAVS